MAKVIIGLTGPTGAGKSTATRAAQSLGFFIINADEITRYCQRPNSPLLKELEAAFGDVLNSDGSLNRSALAEKAFKSSDTTKLLNSIVLPKVMEEINRRINEREEKFILLDAPTLFEAGADAICKDTIGVLAENEIRLKRIMERDNIPLSAAKTRMSAGKDDKFYIKRCGHIIYNNKGEKEFQDNALKLFQQLKDNFNES